MTSPVFSAVPARPPLETRTTSGRCTARQRSPTPTSRLARLTAHMGAPQLPHPLQPTAATRTPSRRKTSHRNASHRNPSHRNPSQRNPSHRSPQPPGLGMWKQNVAQHPFPGITLARCAIQALLYQATTGVLIQKIVAGSVAAHGARTVRKRHTASTRTCKDPSAACLPPSPFQSAALQEWEPSSCSQGSLRLLGSAPGEGVGQRATSTSSQTWSLWQRCQCSQKPWPTRSRNMV